MSQADDAIAYARAQIGKPYVFGTAGPDTFDCSGLTKAAYAHANPPIDLPHFTGTQILMGTAVSRNDLQPGDLVFPSGARHVQLYVGNGQIIEAQQENVPVRQGPMWGFTTARRVASGGKSIGVLDAAGNFIESLPNPLAPAATIVDVFRPLGVLTMTISRVQFWKRAAMMTVGASLVIFGFIYFNRRPLGSVAGAVVNGATSIAGTAIQGAAFGFGTGGAVGGGAARSVSGAPVTAIAPVRRGIPRAPASAVPITVPRPISPPRSPVRVSAQVGSGLYHGRPSVSGVGVAKPPPRRLPGDSTVGKAGRHRQPKSRNYKNPSNDIV